MITYRKTNQLRIRRTSAPQPPWFCATAVSPYGPRRGSPVSIDYLDLRASSADRVEVAVCDAVDSEMERSAARFEPPLLIEASGIAEQIFRRGEDALTWAASHGFPALHLISTEGAVPESVPAGSVIAVAVWPDAPDSLAHFAAQLRERGARWGMAVPIVFPVTTNLATLRAVADLAQANGASFLASIPVDLDATAKQAIAQSLTLEGGEEDYAMLFHSDLEPVHVATERHLAALAAERGMEDFVVPPGWNEKTNWNASALLNLTATRMIAMEQDVELAGMLARSARAIGELDKPLSRIAASASLSIVESLDEISADILTDWLAGNRSPFIDRVTERWRLRRDVGV